MFTAIGIAVALTAQGAVRDTAVVYLSNRVVAVFRAPLGALSPTERADAARRRLLNAINAEDDSLSVRAVPEGALVLLGQRPIFTITREDADTVGGGDLDREVLRSTAELRLALAEEEEARSLPRLLIALAQSLVATLTVILVLRGVRWGHGRLVVPLARVTDRVKGISVRGVELVSARQVVGVTRSVVIGAMWIVGGVITYVYIAFVLTRFPWTRQWGEALGDYLVATLTSAAVAIAREIPDLFIILLIVVGIRILVRLVTTLFRAAEQGIIAIPGIHPETALPTKRLIVALLWVFALALAYPYLPGSESQAFTGVSVFAGILITLGSTGIIGQAMSGLVIVYTRALKVGEYVQISEAEGVVTSVGLLSTKLRTNKLEEITIPSTGVLSQRVKNYSRLGGETGVILTTTVTIGYDAPWRQVHGLLLLAARDTKGVRPTPPPFVRQRALSDFYVEYELYMHTDDPSNKAQLLAEVHARIQDRFNEFGVQIMSPHYEGDKVTPVVVPRERWFADPAREAGSGAAGV